MRLIDVKTLEVQEFFGTDVPPYIILSHRWGRQEISYQDLIQGRKKGSEGDIKVRTFCSLVDKEYQQQWGWVDTCCIDKSSSAELSEAINSMYQWYENAVLCVVYLKDVGPNAESFVRTQWFERGWTLQEMLAPDVVHFYSQDWTMHGTRNALAEVIAQRTNIDLKILEVVDENDPDEQQLRRNNLHAASVAKKMAWASQRVTTRVEDMAYCLLGLFKVNMPLLYGEGGKAFQRLQREIIQDSDDESIFAWDYYIQDTRLSKFPRELYAFSILASSPAEFSMSHYSVSYGFDVNKRILANRKPYRLTNKGLQMEVHLLQINRESQLYGIPINCSTRYTQVPLIVPVVWYTSHRNSMTKYCRAGPLWKPSWNEWHGLMTENIDLLNTDKPRHPSSRNIDLSDIPKQEIFLTLHDVFPGNRDIAFGRKERRTNASSLAAILLDDTGHLKNEVWFSWVNFLRPGGTVVEVDTPWIAHLDRPGLDRPSDKRSTFILRFDSDE